MYRFYTCPFLLDVALSVVMPFITVKYLSKPWRDAHRQKKAARKIAELKRARNNDAKYADLMRKLSAFN